MAEDEFGLDDEGNVVPKDGRFGKNGKTLYTVKEWMEDLRETFPIFFVNGNTGSSQINGGKGGSGKISQATWDALPFHERQKKADQGIFPS